CSVPRFRAIWRPRRIAVSLVRCRLTGTPETLFTQIPPISWTVWTSGLLLMVLTSFRYWLSRGFLGCIRRLASAFPMGDRTDGAGHRPLRHHRGVIGEKIFNESFEAPHVPRRHFEF